MMDLNADIKTGLNTFGIGHTEENLKHLCVYADQILEFNRSLNLVSKSDPEKEIIKQIIDSTALIKYVTIKPDCSLLDLGSGGGFPGIVIKILRPEIELVSLDSSPKKILFQERTAGRLGLEGCEFIAKPLEEYKPGREIDLITSKALGKFKRTFAFLARFLGADGRAVFYTGEQISPEFEEAGRKGLARERVISYRLPVYPGKYQLVILKKN
jgi:16S rRNA (guanine527-N7)-methyltransferase